jgi:hypothetical protein
MVTFQNTGTNAFYLGVDPFWWDGWVGPMGKITLAETGPITNGTVVITAGGGFLYYPEPSLDVVVSLGLVAGVAFACAVSSYMLLKRAFVRGDGWLMD